MKDNEIDGGDKAFLIGMTIVLTALLILTTVIALFVQMAYVAGNDRVAACVVAGGTWDQDGDGNQTCTIDTKEP